MTLKILFELPNGFLSHIRWVSDDDVKAGVFSGEDLGEFGVVVEGVDFLAEVIEIPAFAGMTG
jgi:hypothetical protein